MPTNYPTNGMLEMDINKLASYVCTPKYVVKGGSRDTKRMARFYIPETLFTHVQKLFPAAQSDAIFQALHDTSPTGGFFNFLLQNVTESYSENVQVVQTLSDNFITFSMGAKPPVFTYSGTLVNSQEDDWRSQFLLLYSRYLRASKLAKFGGRTAGQGSSTGGRVIQNHSYIKYDNVYVRGAMISLNMSLNAENEVAVPFSFQYLVQNVVLFKQVPTAGFDATIVDQGSYFDTAGDKIKIVNTTIDTTSQAQAAFPLNKLAAKKVKQDTEEETT
jgi:hypothetical protein